MPPRKACPLAARIKKLMQADEDVGKIAQATPVLLGARVPAVGLRCWCCGSACVCMPRACAAAQQRARPPRTPAPPPRRHAARAMEMFLKKLCDGMCDVAQPRQAKALSTSHL